MLLCFGAYGGRCVRANGDLKRKMDVDTHIKRSFDILYQGNQREVKSSLVFTNTHTHTPSLQL